MNSQPGAGRQLHSHWNEDNRSISPWIGSLIMCLLIGGLLLCGHCIATPLVGENTSTVITNPAPVTPATRIIPPGGGAPSEILTNMYPTVKGNAAIMEFIGECGIGNWHEEQMNADFKSVHLPPANACGKQLVFSVRKSAGRDDPTRIADIWIIGANETWSGLMIPAYFSGWIPGVPIVVGMVAFLVIALGAALRAMVRRTRG